MGQGQTGDSHIGSDRNSKCHNGAATILRIRPCLSVRMSVLLVPLTLSCLELSDFIFLAKIFKLSSCIQGHYKEHCTCSQ